MSLLLWASASTQGYYIPPVSGSLLSWAPVAALNQVTSAVFADFDGDNYADLASTTPANPNVFWLSRGQAASAFATPASVSLGACQAQSIVRLANPLLNGTSFAVSCGTSGRTRFVLNPNLVTGVPQNTSSSLAIATSNNVFSMLVAADINGDGRKDVRSLEPNALGYQMPAVSLALTNGSASRALGSFVGTASGNLSEAWAYSSQAQLADINGDDKLDAVVLNANTKFVSVYPGMGDGTFASAATSIFVQGAVAIKVGDVLRNGWPDVLVRTQASIFVLTNAKGTLATSLNQLIADARFTTQMTLRDVNHDGYLDLTTLRSDNTIGIFVWQPQSNAFGTVVTTALAQTANVANFISGDIFHSGDDALVTSGMPIYILTRDGQNFGYNIQQLTSLSGASGLALADLNHDGDLDLIYISQINQTLCVMAGEPNGNFAQASASSCQSLPMPPSASGAPHLVHHRYRPKWLFGRRACLVVGQFGCGRFRQARYELAAATAVCSRQQHRRLGCRRRQQ